MLRCYPQAHYYFKGVETRMAKAGEEKCDTIARDAVAKITATLIKPDNLGSVGMPALFKEAFDKAVGGKGERGAPITVD